MSRPDYCPIGNVPCQSLCDTPCSTSDALQGAADWLCQAIEGCTVADLQSRLKIGYNRASRLFDAVRAQNGEFAVLNPVGQDKAAALARKDR